MATTKHILFINHTRGLHGAEQVLLFGAKAMKERGHRVTIVLPSQVDDAGIEQELMEQGIETIYLRYKVAGDGWWRTWMILLYNLPAMISLCRWIKKEQVDVVYSNTVTTIIGIIVAKWTGRKHLWHFHERVGGSNGWVGSLRGLYHHLTQYPKNVLIFLSHQQQEEWERAMGYTGKSCILRNPIRESIEMKAIPHKGICWGYIGSFGAWKNLPMLLHCFEALHQKHPDTTLRMVGAMKEEDIEDLYAHTSLSAPTVQILPHTRDVDTFYANIDVLVLPSLKETMPLVVIEAMQHGVAVIQTKESGLHELMDGGKDCLFIDPRSQESLLEAMQYCMDTEHRKQLAKNGHNKIVQADWNNNYIQELEDMIW